MTDSIAVFAVFDNQKELRSGVRALNRLGFKEAKKSALSRKSFVEEDFKFENCTEVSNGAWIGALIGAVIGLFVGLYVDQLPLLSSAGLNTTLVAGFLTILGAVLGAGSGALVGIGTPELLSTRYARYMNQGHRILAVHVDSREQAKRATEILYQAGGAEVVTDREESTLQAILKDNPREKKPFPQQRFESARGMA